MSTFVSFSDLSRRLEAAPHQRLLTLKDCRAGIMQKLNALASEAKRRELTEDEKEDFDIFEKHVKVVDQLLSEKYAELEKEKQMPAVRDRNADTYEEFLAKGGDAASYNGHDTLADTGWVDQHGKPVRLLSPQQRIGDQPGVRGKYRNLHVGKLIVGMVTGNWTGREAERLAMGEGINSTGGYLVPDELSAQVIDIARAQTALIRAGVRTIPMGTESLIMARQETDPTMGMVGENETIPETSVTFGAVQFTAKKIAAIVKMSRELMSDAPNAADIVRSSLAAALALKLDEWGLVGTGSQQFDGLSNNANIAETLTVGAIDWLDLHNAIIDIQGRNYEPNAYIVSPVIAGDLATIESGDGTNAARNWLGPPATVAALTQLRTTQATTALGFVGDFSQAAFAIRLGAEIMTSGDAGDSFERNQIWIRLVFRGDFNLLQPGAFHILRGITT